MQFSNKILVEEADTDIEMGGGVWRVEERGSGTMRRGNTVRKPQQKFKLKQFRWKH